MPVTPKIRENIDDMKRMGFTAQDISDRMKANTTNEDGSLKFNDNNVKREEDYKDTGFSEISFASTKTAICHVDGGKLVPSTSEKTNERILLCSVCGRRNYPTVEPLEYATRMKTVLGAKVRKTTSAKLSASTAGGNYVGTDVDEVPRDMYGDRNSIVEKRISKTGDDALIERQSGCSIIEVNEIKPT